MVLGLMGLSFCCHCHTVGSDSGINNSKTWIHPTLYRRFRLVVQWRELCLSTTVSKWPPWLTDLSPLEHLWNVVEQEIVGVFHLTESQVHPGTSKMYLIKWPVFTTRDWNWGRSFVSVVHRKERNVYQVWLVWLPVPWRLKLSHFLKDNSNSSL